jgi:tetratricopeptide (TPR) repeat protein
VPGEPLEALLARARAELAANRLEGALELAKQAEARGAAKGAWRLVTADALRGLGRASEAAEAFELAAYELSGPDAYEAGYSAAYLLFKEVQAPQRALEVLERTAVDAAGSPLEERGLVLRVRILDRLGRRADARPFAERYLARYPNGGGRSVMQAVLAPAPAK